MDKWEKLDLSQFGRLMERFGVEVRNLSIPGEIYPSAKVFTSEENVLRFRLSEDSGMFEFMLESGEGYARCKCGRAFRGEIYTHVH